MSINGIGTAAYPIERYPARKAEKSAEFGTAGFMDIAAEKAAQDEAANQDEKAFEMVGRGAPQGVKDAWMDAAKEVNANGMGIRGNGMMSHTGLESHCGSCSCIGYGEKGNSKGKAGTDFNSDQGIHTKIWQSSGVSVCDHI